MKIIRTTLLPLESEFQFRPWFTTCKWRKLLLIAMEMIVLGWNRNINNIQLEWKEKIAVSETVRAKAIRAKSSAKTKTSFLTVYFAFGPCFIQLVFVYVIFLCL